VGGSWFIGLLVGGLLVLGGSRPVATEGNCGAVAWSRRGATLPEFPGFPDFPVPATAPSRPKAIAAQSPSGRLPDFPEFPDYPDFPVPATHPYSTR